MGKFSYEDLGGKLRAIRKAKHVTLSEVAQFLNKSVSTVAKYETGEISIDLESFIMLCQFYKVNSSDLLFYTDFKTIEGQHNRYGKQMIEKSYLYYYRAYDKWIHKCVLQNDNTTFKSTLYFGVKSENDPYHCEYVYEGTVHYTDSHTYYVFYNIAKPFDMITINLSSLGRGDDYKIGLLSSITVYYQNMAGKILVSEKPVKDEQFLKENLIITKDVLKEIKRTNFFIL